MAHTLVSARAPETTADPTTSPDRTTRRRSAGIALLVTLISLLVYLASPVRLETDSFWVVFTARSLVAHGDVDLDEFDPIIDRGTGFQIERFRGHRYYEAPLATSLFAVPFVAVDSLIEGHDLDARLADGHAMPLDGRIAALLAAIATGLMFLVVTGLTTRRWIALVTTATFAFGTQVWSTASRTLWMHGPSLVCITLALLLASRARSSGRCCMALGAALGLAYFVRPTNVVLLVVLAVWVARWGVRPFLRYALGAAAVAATFIVLDLWLYGRAFQPYFRSSRIGVSATTVEALLGNLVSPSRGLIVFVPVALLCAYGVLLKRQAGVLSSLDVALVVTVIGSWLVVSAFPSWWAGWSYGPRFLTDVLPMVLWFLPPALAEIADRRHAGFAVVACVLIALSVAINARGALAPSTVEWNWKPVDIGVDRGRLWDWTDPQFLR